MTLRRCLGALSLLMAASLTGCALLPTDPIARQLASLLPSDALLLGEQHDAPDHAVLHARVTQALAERRQLAALALEMAPQGGSTAGLPAGATETQVQAALQWDARAWPWERYAPAVMAAVRAGVPVLGANLPNAGMRGAMADALLDQGLPPEALEAQRRAIREGHCGLLPESQIAPMTRVQIARDRAMADTVARSVRPGQTVLLLTGHGHAHRDLGVPRHLAPEIRSKSVIFLASQGKFAMVSGASFDAVWPTAAAPERDYCAEFKASRAGPAQPAAGSGP